MIQSAVEEIQFAKNTLFYNEWEILVCNFLLFLSIFGFVGSGAIIFSSYFYQRTPHGLIILSMCLSVFLSCSSGFIAMAINLSLGGLLSGDAGLKKCMIEGYIQLITFSISLLSLTLIAGEQYFSVFHGIHDHSKRVLLAITCCWIYAIGYASTSLDSGYNYRLLSGRMACSIQCSIPSMFPYCMYAAVSTNFFLSLAAYCYWKLFIFYKQSNIQRRNSKGYANEKILLWKFTIIVVSFIVLTFPFFSGFLYEAITGELTNSIFGQFSLTLIFLNQAINPYLLYWLDPAIRQQINQVFGLHSISRILFPKPNTEVVQLIHEKSPKKDTRMLNEDSYLENSILPTVKL